MIFNFEQHKHNNNNHRLLMAREFIVLNLVYNILKMNIYNKWSLRIIRRTFDFYFFFHSVCWLG